MAVHTHRANSTGGNFWYLLKFRISNGFNSKRLIYENPSISRSQSVSLNVYQTFLSSLGEAWWQKPWDYIGSPAKLLAVPHLVITQTFCHKKGCGKASSMLIKAHSRAARPRSSEGSCAAVVSRLCLFNRELNLTVNRQHRNLMRLEAQAFSINFLESIWTF